MSANSKIEWCDHTFNPWEGCQKVGPGCDHCYAEARNARFSGGQALNWGPGAPRRRTSAANWRLPLKWNAQAQDEGRRFRVFCASLADVFDNEVPAEWRQDLFELIRSTPHLDWLLLTKRIGNAEAMIRAALANMDIGYSVPFAAWPWPNVWIGATVVNQEEADRDIPKLLAVPARVRFLSIEPMLGPIDLRGTGAFKMATTAIGAATNTGWHQVGVHWVIAGGESGPGARPMHPDWARSLRNQCAAAGVPFLFKQWGEWGPDWEGAETCGNCGETKFDAINSLGECGRCGVDDWQAAATPLDKLRRVGKKAAGRLLDGVQHDGFPE